MIIDNIIDITGQKYVVNYPVCSKTTKKWTSDICRCDQNKATCHVDRYSGKLKYLKTFSV